ncbi:MAG: hypothetical protein ACE5E6_07580 [Phycisphaerae bacterium]
MKRRVFLGPRRPLLGGRRGLFGWTAFAAFAAGCGELGAPPSPPLFAVPVAVEGRSIGHAVIDTGGGYELMLREPYDLAVVDTAEVLAFGGTEQVLITEGFTYTAGGVDTVAEFALLGVSVCDCNGLGFRFFQRTGVILGLDFTDLTPRFVHTVPPGGTVVAFHAPPDILSEFDSAFIEVDVSASGTTRRVLGVLDTGANVTVLRRGVLPGDVLPMQDRMTVTVAHTALGTVAGTTMLFDTPGLPDMILGVDIMQAWGDRWYFDYTSGGTITVFAAADRDGVPKRRAVDRAGRSRWVAPGGWRPRAAASPPQ